MQDRIGLNERTKQQEKYHYHIDDQYQLEK